MADDVVVDLARAEDEPADRRLVGNGGVEDRLERALGERVERRGRLFVAQQPLRGHHHERARARVERLPAQEVEVLRGRRAVGDPQVLLRGELQEAFEPRARVLRAVAFVRVRQEQRQPRGLLPLGEAARDELVDHDLRPVREVAELRFPEHERLRGGRRVAVLEADAGVLREGRVVDLERRLGAVELLDRHVQLPRVGVVQDEMTMREGAALGVLTRQPHGDPVEDERAERERLGMPPVDPALVERDEAAFELAFQLGVDREALRHAQQLCGERTELLRRHAGVDRAGGVAGDALFA